MIASRVCRSRQRASTRVGLEEPTRSLTLTGGDGLSGCAARCPSASAHAPLIVLYELGGKAAVAGLFVFTGGLLAALCRLEFAQAGAAARPV